MTIKLRRNTRTYSNMGGFPFGIYHNLNLPPVAIPDTYTHTMNGGAITLDVLVNDTDEDNDALTITAASVSATAGTVVITANKLVYTPATNYLGNAVISYTISDGTHISSSTATVNVYSWSANSGALTYNGDSVTYNDEEITYSQEYKQ
jgi:hypothetical protein